MVQVEGEDYNIIPILFVILENRDLIFPSTISDLFRIPLFKVVDPIET